MINISANRLREEYRDFISSLPDQIKIFNKDLRKVFAIDSRASLWWLSLVANNNVFKSDFFNRLSQFDALARVIKEKSPDAIFMGCGNVKLRSALRHFARENRIKIDFGKTEKVESINEWI